MYFSLCRPYIEQMPSIQAHVSPLLFWRSLSQRQFAILHTLRHNQPSSYPNSLGHQSLQKKCSKMTRRNFKNIVELYVGCSFTVEVGSYCKHLFRDINNKSKFAFFGHSKSIYQLQDRINIGSHTNSWKKTASNCGFWLEKWTKGLLVSQLLLPEHVLSFWLAQRPRNPPSFGSQLWPNSSS